jgi:copper chaperone CopZ
MKQARTLAIEGMTCDNCIRHVTRALMGVKGVDVKDVSIGSARVEYDPGDVLEATIVNAVREAGYQVRIAAA